MPMPAARVMIQTITKSVDFIAASTPLKVLRVAPYTYTMQEMEGIDQGGRDEK